MYIQFLFPTNIFLNQEYLVSQKFWLTVVYCWELLFWWAMWPTYLFLIAAVAQSVKAFAPQVHGWVFESIRVIKVAIDSSTSKRSAVSASVTGPL